MDGYENFNDARLRHLDMIQGVIARLGTNGFVIKGWAITVVGAFVAFAVNQRDWQLATVSATPIVMFWALDAYFLQAERRYRCLFERVRRGDPTLEPFFMGATAPTFVASLSKEERRATCFWSTAWRPTLRYLYLGLAAAAIAVALIVGLATDDRGSEPSDPPDRSAHAEFSPQSPDRSAAR